MSSGSAGGWKFTFSGRCSGLRALVGMEGDAKRSSVSSASLLERERELRSGGLTPTGAIVFARKRRLMFTRPNRRPFEINLFRMGGK